MASIPNKYVFFLLFLFKNNEEGLYLVSKCMCRKQQLGTCTWFQSAFVEQLRAACIPGFQAHV